MGEVVTRREFLSCACAAGAFVAAGAALAGCSDSNPVNEPPPPGSGITISGNTVTLDLTGNLAKAVATSGGFLFISQAQVVVLNTDGQTIRAFTSVCTHEQCDVSRFQNSRLVCPCHNSQFDTSGAVVQGPATRSLKSYAVVRDGNAVTITKS